MDIIWYFIQDRTYITEDSYKNKKAIVSTVVTDIRMRDNASKKCWKTEAEKEEKITKK